jgi:alkanesulfonate monooxygenase SsuD/methylene tetrahydromethanopterin reductase-like flavin-dependent oxidoreductase (luciferase family)
MGKKSNTPHAGGLSKKSASELKPDSWQDNTPPIFVGAVHFHIQGAMEYGDVIAFAATIYPAHQASRLMPVEAIRHE